MTHRWQAFWACVAILCLAATASAQNGGCNCGGSNSSGWVTPAAPSGVYYQQPAAAPTTAYYVQPAAAPTTAYYSRPVAPANAYYVRSPAVSLQPVGGVQQAQACTSCNQSAPATAYYTPASSCDPCNPCTPVVCNPCPQPVICCPTPTYYSAPQSTYTLSPILPVFGVPQNSYIGRGSLGQAKVYVEGQPVRNFAKYLWPL